MPSVTGLLRRLLYLARRDRYTAELAEELRLHVLLRAEKLESGGLAPEAAAYAAKRRFGNLVHIQERSRDMWGMNWFEQALTDLKFAARRLRSRPAFSLPTIAVAALGIGVTTAVFSAVDAAILRPLPFYHADELVTLTHVGIPSMRVKQDEVQRLLNVIDIGEMPQVFASTAGFAAGALNLDDPVAPRRIRAGVVTADFFKTLGVAPVVGRAFAAEEGRPNGSRVVVISDAVWHGQFGGSDIGGKTLMLSGRRYDVIGVMPRSFGFPAESEVWIPLSVPTSPETYAPFRGYLPSRVIARLQTGVSIGAASRQLIARWVLHRGPSEPGVRLNLDDYLDEIRTSGAAVPFQENMVGERRKGLLILMGATLLLLLIAAANVANLLLSDGASRTREIALREVLGASRGRVVRQLLVEGVVLSLAGAVVGLALAPATLGILRAMMPADLAGSAPVHIDLRVLVFATGLALLTGIVFALWPAMGTSRIDAAQVIKTGGGHGATSSRLGNARRLLITAELALTVMLLVGSGLMLKSFYRLMAQDFGMNPDRAGTLELSFAGSAAAEIALPGATAAVRMRRVRAMMEHLAADPAVQSVGVVNDLPLRGGGGIGIGIKTIGVPKVKKAPFPRYLIASGGYFRALGIPLLKGRVFDALDDSVGPRAVIVNSTMAKAFWPNTEALGRQFYFAGDTLVPYTVVGIVADVREGSLDGKVSAQMYFSADERPLDNLALVARSTLPPAELLARLTGAVRFAAPGQAVYNVRMMEDVVGTSVAPRRTNTLLIALFGALALVLSAFGVYAVVSYSVAQRSREFGIRSALGASRADIVSLVSRDMTMLIGVGLAVGLGGAWALSRVLASMLYEVTTHDLPTFLLVPGVLLVPAAIATLVPALRAIRVSPTEVMRAE